MEEDQMIAPSAQVKKIFIKLHLTQKFRDIKRIY